MFDTSKIKSSAVAALIAVAALFSFSSSALAQSATGGIRGVVTDPTGATLPGATVTARNLATGVELKTTATNEGVYTIARILPGKYNVAVEAPWFKKTEVTDIAVSVGKDAVIDIKLETGAISEVVNVTGGSEALVEKDTVQISTTFQEKKIKELPAAPGTGTGSGLDQLAFLAPGVTPGFGNINANGMQLSINGNRSRSTRTTTGDTGARGLVRWSNDFSLSFPRAPRATSGYYSTGNCKSF